MEPSTSPQIAAATRKPDAVTRELTPFASAEGTGDPIARPEYANDILKQLSKLGRQNEEIIAGHKDTTSGLATLDARVTTLAADMKRDNKTLADRVAEVESELRTGKHSIAPADSFAPVEFSIPSPVPPPADTRRDVMTSGRVAEIAHAEAQRTQSDPDVKLEAMIGVMAGEVTQIKGAVLSKEDVMAIAKEANTAQTDAIVKLVEGAAKTTMGRRILQGAGIVILLALGVAAARLQQCSGAATVGVSPAVSPAASSR